MRNYYKDVLPKVCFFNKLNCASFECEMKKITENILSSALKL